MDSWFEKSMQEALLNGKSDAVAKLINVNNAKKYINYRDISGATMLHWASLRGLATEGINTLISFGSNVNARDASGSSPLSLAALKGHVDVAKLLILSGANANNTDDFGLTPIHLASQNGNYEMLGLLLENYDDSVDLFDSQCKTPLHHAAQSGSAPCISLLLARGANVRALDSFGKYPIDYVPYYSIEAANLLRNNQSGLRGMNDIADWPINTAPDFETEDWPATRSKEIVHEYWPVSIPDGHILSETSIQPIAAASLSEANGTNDNSTPSMLYEPPSISKYLKDLQEMKETEEEIDITSKEYNEAKRKIEEAERELRRAEEAFKLAKLNLENAQRNYDSSNQLFCVQKEKEGTSKTRHERLLRSLENSNAIIEKVETAVKQKGIQGINKEELIMILHWEEMTKYISYAEQATFDPSADPMTESWIKNHLKIWDISTRKRLVRCFRRLEQGYGLRKTNHFDSEVEYWSTDDVLTHIASEGLDGLSTSFKAMGVDGVTLAELTDEDLAKELELTNPDYRQEILAKIARIIESYGGYDYGNGVDNNSTQLSNDNSSVLNSTNSRSSHHHQNSTPSSYLYSHQFQQLPVAVMHSDWTNKIQRSRNGE